MKTFEDRIKELQTKPVLTEGERVELERLLSMKWGSKPVDERTQDTRQLLVEG